MRMQLVGSIPESGEVLMHCHERCVYWKTKRSSKDDLQRRIIILCLTEQTRHVDKSRRVWCCTWVVIIMCLTKQTQHVNRSIWVWWRTWVVCRPWMWVQGICIILLSVTNVHIHHKTAPFLNKRAFIKEY